MSTDIKAAEALEEAEGVLDDAECQMSAKQKEIDKIDAQIALLMQDREQLSDELTDLEEAHDNALQAFNRLSRG